MFIPIGRLSNRAVTHIPQRATMISSRFHRFFQMEVCLGVGSFRRENVQVFKSTILLVRTWPPTLQTCQWPFHIQCISHPLVNCPPMFSHRRRLLPINSWSTNNRFQCNNKATTTTPKMSTSPKTTMPQPTIPPLFPT